MISAAAFVCAHAGWTLITPQDARASSEGSGGDQTARIEPEPDPVRSPFELGDAVSQPPPITLLAVRMSTRPERSSAIVDFGDGAQRAFLSGARLGDGLVLGEVGANYVVLEHAGGQQRVELKPLSVSYASAMLGRGKVEGG